MDRVRYSPEEINGGVHNGVEFAVVYFGTARRFFSFAKTPDIRAEVGLERRGGGRKY